ncbi:MAG: NCS2 family permease [Candidatus Aceula lacicola]|nr:NCS2 family permease [Candidatus Aceula lacicola]
MLDRFFSLSENKTTIRQELLAGLTTFLTMAYIIFLQPAILSKDFAGNPTGLDFGAVLLATCVISAFATIFMGLFANYPIALAPGMGENFFFVSVIMALTGLGFANAWQVALGIVFIAGVVFLILSLLRVREMIINSISPSMRSGIAVGIGLFITFIGFQHGKVIVANPGTMVELNTHFVSPDIAVFALGLIVASILQVRKIKGSILWGILASTVLALLLGQITFSGFIGFPEVHAQAAFAMDLKAAFSLTCLPFIIVFLFMDMFDTVGTLLGVAETAGFVKDDKLPRASRVLVVDATATVGGACLGTSTVTAYVESAAGVAAGGRTGLTNLATGSLFLIALCFGPLIGMIGKYPPITAPALIIVGSMMIQNVKKINWDDYSESIPSFLIMAGIPFCYSIADGLALGFISYPIIKMFSKKAREVSWLMYFMAAILLVYFLLVRSKMG